MKPLARDVLKRVRALDHVYVLVRLGSGIVQQFEVTKKDFREGLRALVVHDAMAEIDGTFSDDYRLFWFTQFED